jgi:hypothetical protein
VVMATATDRAVWNSRLGRGQIFFVFHNFPTGYVNHPTLGIYRSERDDDYSPLSSSEVKNEWRCTSTPLLCPRDVSRIDFAFCLHKHKVSNCTTYGMRIQSYSERESNPLSQNSSIVY